ncbi:hypothetical protein C8J56DRAFT_564281 [Mycena floridula]|nr:hypothetical protein C8J56DRAFT_564281 [Mycena floridula]
MQTQPMMLTRPESPLDNGPLSTLHHIQPPDPLYHLQHSQSSLYTNSGSTSSMLMSGDYSSDLDAQKNQQSGKMSNFATRSNFNSYPNSNRPRHHQQGSGIPYRELNGFYPPSAVDAFPPQLTSPTQQHMQPFDSRTSYDFSGSQGLVNGNHKSPNYSSMIDYNNSGLQQLKPISQQQQSQLNGYGPQNASYSTPMHLSSQTPFGPHIPSSAGLVNGNGSLPVINQTNGLGMLNNMVNVQAGQQQQQEEISTIFVVGFPDDMQEREFQNMFTFSPGFEAATLKIPNKEYTAYGGVGAPGVNGTGSSRGYGQYGGSNDPYNLVTVNQGGVVVDGREGTMASWPAIDEGTGGHYAPGMSMPPRKQIIGFAKFRSKEEALAAKDMLQGKRVDIEKGAVLKAEMAKKNLHTKRGVGPVPGSATVPPGSAGVGPGFGTGGGLNILPQQSMMNGVHSDYNIGDPITVRDRDTLGAMGLGRMPWPDSSMAPRDREEEERKREREMNVLGAMGLGGPGNTRGARERAEDEERERRRREKEMQRLRGGSSAAYDNFHPSSISRQTSNGVILSPPGAHSLLSPLENPAQHHLQQLHQQSDERVIVGPWDNLRQANPIAPIRAPSHRSTSPANVEGRRSCSPPDPEQPQSDSRASSVASGSHHEPNGNGSEEEMFQSMGGLAVSTNRGNTSPQLPSPASGASSGSTRNGVDQNPPINTLYVGNLPTSPPPPGMPPDMLEASLRELFQSRPGFRRLSFKQKNSGPMCFVEFEDVNHAAKTLNDLYGNTLKGLVKGGGIRLSYSKNPLGVRTPTSANSSGPALQQQQAIFQNNPSHFGQLDDRPLVVRRGVVPQAYANSSAPPPRFATSPTFDAPPTSGPLTGIGEFMSRNSMSMYGYSPTALSSFSPFGLSSPSHSTIPDQNEPDLRTDQHSYHYSRPLSPASNLEAARAS